MKKEGFRKLLKENRDLVWEVLTEDSDALADLLRRVMEKRPDVVMKVISLANVATKDDIKIIHEEIKLIVDMFNGRFEDMNRRFEEMDRRFDMLFRITLAFDIPITVSIFILLLKSFGVM